MSSQMTLSCVYSVPGSCCIITLPRGIELSQVTLPFLFTPSTCCVTLTLLHCYITQVCCAAGGHHGALPARVQHPSHRTDGLLQ
jgi:hypothetical protein